MNDDAAGSPDLFEDISRLTEDAFTRGIKDYGYPSALKATHDWISARYYAHRDIHDEYFAPTATEHVVDTDNQPGTANHERANAVQRVNKQSRRGTPRSQQYYPSDIVEDVVDVTTKSYQTTNRLDHVSPLDAGSLAASVITLFTGAATVLAGADTVAATMAAAYPAITVGRGAYAAHKANQIQGLLHDHADKHYDDGESILEAALEPRVDEAQRRLNGKHALLTTARQAAKKDTATQHSQPPQQNKVSSHNQRIEATTITPRRWATLTARL